MNSHTASILGLVPATRSVTVYPSPNLSREHRKLTRAQGKQEEGGIGFNNNNKSKEITEVRK